MADESTLKILQKLHKQDCIKPLGHVSEEVPDCLDKPQLRLTPAPNAMGNELTRILSASYNNNCDLKNY